jgi:hypothetical protein
LGEIFSFSKEKFDFVYIECRSVKNPVEAGNVFCASVEGGYRGAVSQAEG